MLQIAMEAILLKARKHQQKDKTTKSNRELCPVVGLRGTLTSSTQIDPSAAQCFKIQKQPCTLSQPHVPLQPQTQESLICQHLKWRCPCTTTTHSMITAVSRHVLYTRYLVQIYILFALEGFRNTRDEWKNEERTKINPNQTKTQQTTTQNATEDP